MALIRFKRGTRAQLDAAATANELSAGEPYLVTDEERVAVGTATNDYTETVKPGDTIPIEDGGTGATTAAGARTALDLVKQTDANDRTPGRVALVNYLDALISTPAVNDIGTPGTLGYMNGIYPGTLPAGWSEMAGTTFVGHDNYGNYQYSDGSVCVWWPAFYYRIGHVDNPTYPTYGVNSVHTLPFSAFTDETDANAAGYALWRSFKNGGEIKLGKMLDKYGCSNNGGIASSLRYGNPLSSNSLHNPFSGLTGAPANNYAGALDAAKTRGSQFHVMALFDRVGRALCSMAHGQAATSTSHCAWYDPTGTTNFPKGNNNNALGDVDDAEILYIRGSYLNAGLCGSGTPFAKTTDNGQNCGIADLNGNMWEINLGMTRPGDSAGDTAQQDDAAAFYILKESVDINTLTSGWHDGVSAGLETDAWGNATHLATLYDAITLAHISEGWQRFGNGANAVLDSALSGDGYRQTACGIYTADGHPGAP